MTGKGRVVILVDNDVSRDSRVQKQARSMADAGWDVVLLGQTPGKQPRRWKLGKAEVRLVPTPRLLHRRAGDLRRSRLRDPLAYSSGWLADTRAQTVKARQADLRVRRIEASAGEAGPADRLGLLAARAVTKAQDRWVALRAEHTRRLTDSRISGDSRVDRLTTAFWQKALGDEVWRRFDPHLWDWELAYGPEVDRLGPDIIHANDFRMLGVGARAAVRAGEQGRQVRLVWDAHEFLPGVKPWEENPRWHLAQMAHERKYARAADAVVTVSEELASLLRETHRLPEQPSVVLNCPYAADTTATLTSPGIREAAGAGPDQPVMVYSGAVSPARGLDVMIEAMPQLPEVVCALVVNKPESDYMKQLLGRARELGVMDRIRVLPYVPFEEVVPFLSTADVGVIPINHWPNHEIQLITKYFEYAHARLPMVVSDVRVMAETARDLGHGEVFAAGDADSFAAAVRKVLADPERYRKAYTDEQLHEWTWEAQAEVLDAVYTRVMTK
ncbi:MAG TPA: glycosyltransferase family 4 protein [Nocardioidaceae bacterium]|nr:glycosyltransferase family 4 protein [Nocardioidaceae bacterium]